jgi:hypothetical protein
VQKNMEDNPYAIVPYKSSLLINLPQMQTMTVQATGISQDNIFGMPLSLSDE